MLYLVYSNVPISVTSLYILLNHSFSYYTVSLLYHFVCLILYFFLCLFVCLFVGHYIISLDVVIYLVHLHTVNR